MHTGVGVDIRVHHSLVFGLSANVEDLLQEDGRSMRGSESETLGARGYSFFLHKGSLGNWHEIYSVLMYLKFFLS